MMQPIRSKNTVPMHAVRWMLAACLATTVAVAAGGTASAADGPEEEPAAGAQPEEFPRGRPDFLFGQPRGVVGFSGGWLRASGGGVLDWFRSYLVRGVDAGGEFIPIGERAYDTALFRFTGGFSLTPRVDLMFDVTPANRTLASEYEEFSEDGRPITQSTTLWQVPMNASVRYWLAPRGRAVGRLAWVPSTVAFHVGAGGGLRWYRLEQFGDFVDFADLSIHTDRLRSQGWTLTRHVSAGASFRLTPRLFAVAEVRQVWSQTAAADIFGFGDIDLNGLHMTGGIEFVF